MNYLNLDIPARLGSEEYLGCEPLDRSTWIQLLAYCATHENGGRIADCAGWGERKWLQLVRVMKSEVQRECPLWAWEGNDLVLWGYPKEQQEEVQRRREAGRNGGKAKSAAKAEAARANGANGGRPETQAETQAEGPNNPSKQGGKTQANGPENPTERKGKERNEMEECICSGAGVCEPCKAAGRSRPPVELPSLEKTLAYAKEHGIEAEAAQSFWLAHDARAISPRGYWTDQHGHEIHKWQSALLKWGHTWRGNQQQQQQRYGSSKTTPAGASRNAGTANSGQGVSYAGVGRRPGS